MLQFYISSLDATQPRRELERPQTGNNDEPSKRDVELCSAPLYLNTGNHQSTREGYG